MVRSGGQDILDYCEGDVAALERLLPAMLPHIDLPRALFRGRYMAAAAAMEFNGVPIDVPTLELSARTLGRYQGPTNQPRSTWITACYEGAHLQEDTSSRNYWFASASRGRAGKRQSLYLKHRYLPRNGEVVSDHRAATRVAARLSELRLNDLSGRRRRAQPHHRWAFGSKSGRNQPQYEIHLRPERLDPRADQAAAGYAVAYVDWNQEIGIAAALSGDEAMMADLQDRRPLSRFRYPEPASAARRNEERHTASKMREMIKTCVLGHPIRDG